MAKDIDRVSSFSVPPTDVEGLKLVKELKAYCEKTGMSFSFLCLEGLGKVKNRLKKEGKLK